MTTTWVLVADRARARLFSIDESRSFEEIEDFLNPAAQAKGHDIDRGRLPSTHDRMGENRHAIEPHTSAREKSAEFFARELDAALERGRAGHRYDELVLVAPPQFLGALNAALDQHVRASVVEELPKDLTGVDVLTLREHLPPRFHRPEPFPG
jgi:protein required for attachment to host cells